MFANKSRKLLNIINSIEKIYEIIKIYHHDLTQINFDGANPNFTEFINNSLSSVNSEKYIKYINAPKQEFKKNLDTIYKIEYYISSQLDKIKYILNIFQESKLKNIHLNKITSNGLMITIKLVKTMNKVLDSIHTEYLNLKEIIQLEEYRKILLIPVTHNTNIDIDTINDINSIYEYYVQNNNGEYVIDLYIDQMSTMMEVLSKNDNVYKYITNYLEHLKTQILIPLDEFRNNRINIIQDTIQRFGLIPITAFDSLPELLSNYIKIKKLSQNVFDKLAKITGHTVLLFVKNTDEPIEYNNWVLTDRNYLEKRNLYQKMDIGVNKTMIDRFVTIQKLPHIEGLNMDDGIYVYKSTGDMSLILETFDGAHYRFLSLYSQSPLIPLSRIQSIIDKNYPSRRLLGYNQIINEEIKKYISHPVEDIPKLNLSNIKYRIMEEFREFLKPVRNEKDNTKILKFFKSQKLISKLVNIIENIITHDDIEVRLSILAEIDKFHRQINNDFNSLINDADMNLDDILNELLDKNISRNKNIFINILTKKMIINTFINFDD